MRTRLQPRSGLPSSRKITAEEPQIRSLRRDRAQIRSGHLRIGHKAEAPAEQISERGSFRCYTAGAPVLKSQPPWGIWASPRSS